MIPAAILPAISAALRALGDDGPIGADRPVAGGDINQAAVLYTPVGRYFLKWNPTEPIGMFAAEARGLALLGASGAVRVPQVLGWGAAQSGVPGFLLLEWIEPGGQLSSPAAQASLARALAALHRVTGPAYGLDHDNYIGSTPQANQQMASWPDFFREQRLRPQVARALRFHRLPAGTPARLERLIVWLDELLAHAPAPALLHGDLWAGNVIIMPGDQPCLVDPAVYYGDRECDLAFTTLFGGFGKAFYQAYEAEYPLTPGYAERFAIYNLYHLLNHLNLFGGAYALQVDQAVRAIVG